MLLALDVHYKADYAKTVGLLFDWEDAEPKSTVITQTTEVEEYIPGQFYKRELPCLLQAIDQVDLANLEAIIVDGHVYIDNKGGHGLGGYLWEALDQKIPIIGVAKRAFHANEKMTIPVLRGGSKNALYVSAVGTDLSTAANQIKKMHGDFRMPAILQILDTETKKD